MARQKTGSLGIGNFRLYHEREKDQYIGALVAEWEKEKKEEGVVKKPLPFVTLSRQFGCMTLETGLRLTERLNQRGATGPGWAVYDKEIVEKIAEDLRISKRLTRNLTEGSRSRIAEYMEAFFGRRSSQDEVFQKTVQVVRSLCERGHAVVVGRGGCKIAADMPNGFHVRIVAPFAWRVEEVAAFYELSKEAAQERVRMIDASRQAFFKGHFDQDISEPELHDMVLNQAKLPMDVLVDLVVQGMVGKGLL